MSSLQTEVGSWSTVCVISPGAGKGVLRLEYFCAEDRGSLSAAQLMKSAMQTMNGVSLQLSNMKRSLDDKDQQIKMLHELNKILQLQASMHS